uniref:Uncharacterized protein n=1 Tax=viral metagenome TaxID=1070528 RepID=A0A6M3M5E5_9ZZZZ
MEFRQFDQHDWVATLAKWMAEAESGDLFPNEVQQRLAWIEGTLTTGADQSPKQLAYGVFAPRSQIAIATCELVLTDRGALAERWLKMLKVTLSPEIELAVQAEDMEATNIAVNAYKAAVLGSFSERLTHDADTLKLYGRNDELLRFLMVLMITISQDPSLKLSATREGRWLVIKSLE